MNSLIFLTYLDQQWLNSLSWRGDNVGFLGLLFYFLLAVTRSILNGNMFKNGVLAPIFNFSVHTGSRVSVSKMSYHAYDQAWAYAVWISKIRLLVLRILAKSLFPSKPEVDFQRQHFSIITSIKPEHMPFEFRKSVYWFSRYEQKAFSRLNRKYISSDNNFLSSLLSNLKISRLNFENPSINTQVMSQKPVFEGHFQFSWRNRK